MAFGIECGDGWYDIIDDMCHELEKLDNNDLEFSQIKEKYGALTVYEDGGDIQSDIIIENAGKRSLVTCEVCGEIGRLNRDDGWLAVRCPEHRE